MVSETSTRARKYGLYFLAWTLVGFFLASQSLTQGILLRDPTPWWATVGAFLAGVYLLALLTPGILWLGRRFPIEKRVWVRRVGLHLLISAIFSVVDLALASAVDMHIMRTLPQTYSAAFTVLLLIDFHGGVIAYWIILGGQHGLRYYRKYQEREQQALRLELHASELQRQLAGAQLGALKAQLQPHFLFNTLNAIMVLVRRQRGHEAEETLALLSDLLRCVLEDVEAQEVPLRRELEYLRLYLAIEQIRFQDRLRVEMDIEPAMLDAAVPHMGLQPIVENAIRYGIGRSSAAGKIQICAIRVNESLKISVIDDGPGLLVHDPSNGQGIGLPNTRARLRQLYGDAALLTVEDSERGGVVATMTIPHRVAPEMRETELAELHALDDAAG